MQLVNVASITVRNLFPAKSVLHSARREIRIAALRVPKGEDGALEIVFALLDAEGAAIRVENPDETTADLKRFAHAFVDVLQRI